MEIYKRGEGKLTRRAAFYGLLLLVVWGFKEFGRYLTKFDWAKQVLFGSEESAFVLPYYEMKLRVGVLIAIVLTLVTAWLLFKILNRRTSGELLVDTEAELRKVSWPSWADAKQSTVVVLAFVVAMAAFLTGVEFVLKRVFDFVLTAF